MPLRVDYLYLAAQKTRHGVAMFSVQRNFKHRLCVSKKSRDEGAMA